jgi:hypothetical protein
MKLYLELLSPELFALRRHMTTMQTAFIYDCTPIFLSTSRYTGKERDTESAAWITSSSGIMRRRWAVE